LGDENKVTLSKDMLYGAIIAVLILIVIGSIFTQGFGVVACASAVCPVCENTTAPTQPTVPTEPTEPTEPTAPEELPTLTVEAGTNPVLGNASAPVAIVEFSDFQCPYCGKLYLEGGAEVKANYVDTGKVRYYFRDFPLGFHPNAWPTSIAARCASDQGKYWEMHDKLFDTQSSWSGLGDVGDTMKGYAVELGLDNETFNACYDAQEHTSEINDDFTAGQAYGVRGTPSNFVVISKDNADEASLKSAVALLNSQYGDGIVLFENDNEYTVMIPGAYPYAAFDTVLSVVNY